MRASRLLTILMRLQVHGRISASELARDLEVSVRTIYRDGDQLSAAGVPIYAERGRNGGFQLHEGYRTRLTGLTEAEAEALLLAGLGAAAAELGMGDAASMAQLKLLASLPPGLGASALKAGDRFHLDSRPWYSGGPTLEHLPTLAWAVWNDRCADLTYESWNGEVVRRVDPWGLVLKGGAWYLVAAVQGVPRTYRVSKIRSLKVLDVAFHRPAGFDLGRFWLDRARAFEASLLVGRAEIRISPKGLDLLRDIAPSIAAAVEDVQSPCEPEGWVQASIPVEGEAFTVGLLLRLGREVIVLGPATLRTAVAREAEAVFRLYVQDSQGS